MKHPVHRMYRYRPVDMRKLLTALVAILVNDRAWYQRLCYFQDNEATRTVIEAICHSFHLVLVGAVNESFELEAGWSIWLSGLPEPLEALDLGDMIYVLAVVHFLPIIAAWAGEIPMIPD